MKTISTQVRLTSVLLAALMSTAVLGATVAGMQAGSPTQPAVVVMEHITIKPASVQ